MSERALRYYQELELITPSGRTPGGMRRYSEADLARVTRIRELQSLLGLNLEEIAVVLRNDDRIGKIRELYHDRTNRVSPNAGDLPGKASPSSRTSGRWSSPSGPPSMISWPTWMLISSESELCLKKAARRTHKVMSLGRSSTYFGSTDAD